MAQAWPISTFHLTDYHDWSKDGHVTQAGPMKVSLGVLGEWLRKRSSLSKEMTNCKADGILETGATGTGPA